MKFDYRYGLVLAACLALGACDSKGKEPTGQVVATVDGQEITLRELQAELQGANLPTPEARKAAEQQALQAIINRKVIAAAAKEQKLDKTPDFALQEQRAMEALRANALQKKIVDSVPAPTPDEARRFMAENPHMYAERKIFNIDQIRILRPQSAAELKDFEPLKTLDEVEAMLRAKGINYQKGTDTLDASTIPPQLVQAIVGLPPGEVFVLPTGQVVLINRVRDTRVQPFTGEAAVQHATNLLKNQRTQEAVMKQMTALVKQAEGDIRYNKAYAPPGKAPQPQEPDSKAAQPTGAAPKTEQPPAPKV